MNKWQQFCLQTMNIDRWVLQEKIKVKCYILVQSLNLLPLEKLLLTNILDYKGISLENSDKSLAIIHLAKHATEDSNSSIWVLDDSATTVSLEAENKILKTMSLKNLLANPIDKKRIFEVLDDWMVDFSYQTIIGRPPVAPTFKSKLNV